MWALLTAGADAANYCVDTATEFRMAPEDAAASAQTDTIRIGIASIAVVGVSNVTVSGDPTLAGRYDPSCIAETAPNSELIKRR